MMFNYFKEGEPRIAKMITHGVVGFIGFLLLMGSFTIVDAGVRGVVLRFADVNRVMDSGLNFKIPVIERVVKMEVRTQKIEVGASSASQDLQIVTTNVALQYNLIPERVGDVYKEYKRTVRTRIIDPAIQDSVKASTAQFNAEELITKRPEVKDAIELMLKERLQEAHILVTNVDIVDFDFSESFNKAIEDKVTAEQEALREENRLKKVEFEAQQRIEQARGEAEAIRIQAQAINSQGGEDYVQLQAIAKWNGILPTQFVPGSAIPFLNLIR